MHVLVRVPNIIYMVVSSLTISNPIKLEVISSDIVNYIKMLLDVLVRGCK